MNTIEKWIKISTEIANLQVNKMQLGGKIAIEFGFPNDKTKVKFKEIDKKNYGYGIISETPLLRDDNLFIIWIALTNKNFVKNNKYKRFYFKNIEEFNKVITTIEE